jgi:transcriptional regulator with XRE-family HTH domain
MRPLSPFGRRARNEMMKRGMSLKELAKLLPNSRTKQLGVTGQYVSDIFSGQRDAEEQKQNIADILGIKI